MSARDGSILFRGLPDDGEIVAHDLMRAGAIEGAVLPPVAEEFGGDLDDVDPALMQELLAAPRGPHGVEVQLLSWRLRAVHRAGRIVLLELEPGGPWQLVRISDVRGGPTERGAVHADRDDAERAVLRQRWHDRTGRALSEEPS